MQGVNGSTWPTAVLTSAFCPDFDPERLAMAMCVGYFNGTKTAAPLSFTVAGYVSSKARWRDFEAKWSRALRRESLHAFNAHDFSRETGEFATGWNDDTRRRGLIESLGRLTQQHAFHAFSFSVLLEEYNCINADYVFAETASRPYGLCAALAMAHVRQWMAAKHPDDLTLFVFEQGDLEQRELHRILKAEKAEQGEPAQAWPRQWVDERGRHRYLRPLEACQLLADDQNNALVPRLLERVQLDHQTVDHDRLLRICRALKIAQRPEWRTADVNQATLESR